MVRLLTFDPPTQKHSPSYLSTGSKVLEFPLSTFMSLQAGPGTKEDSYPRISVVLLTFFSTKQRFNEAQPARKQSLILRDYTWVQKIRPITDCWIDFRSWRKVKRSVLQYRRRAASVQAGFGKNTFCCTAATLQQGAVMVYLYLCFHHK